MPENRTPKMGRVRTTVTFDPDVARILERLQKERGVGLSDAVNQVMREADRPATRARPARFVQTTSDMGPFRIPIDDVGEVLDILDEEWTQKKFGR